MNCCDHQYVPENDAEGKYLEEHTRANRQMLLLAGHRERGEREGAIIEGKLEGHMNGVEQHFFAHQLDLQLLVIEMPGHLSYLAHRVVHETSAFAPIM